VATPYVPREELWIVSDWQSHGVRRAEFLSYWLRSEAVRVQLDSGDIIRVEKEHVYRLKRHAIARVTKLIETAIADAEKSVFHAQDTVANYPDTIINLQNEHRLEIELLNETLTKDLSDWADILADAQARITTRTAEAAALRLLHAQLEKL